MRGIMNNLVKSLVMAATVAASSNAMALAVGEAAPQFTAPALQGEQSISLSDYRGKVVYVDFWASWCPPCRISLPKLEQLRSELGADKFEVIAVNLDESSKDGVNFIKDVSPSYPVAKNPEGNIPEMYGLKGMPTAYLIDQSGKVVHIHEGFNEKDVEFLKAEIGKLIQE